jgi:hypothetical protein
MDKEIGKPGRVGTMRPCPPYEVTEVRVRSTDEMESGINDTSLSAGKSTVGTRNNLR